MIKFACKIGQVLFLCLMVVLGLCPQAVWAQSQADTDKATREIQKIQREEQDRLRREIEEQRKKVPPSTEIQVPTPPKPTAKPGGVCINVDKIVFENAPNLSSSDQERLAEPYEGRCLTKADIEKLMSDITADYISRGYSTTRVYLPEQDLSKGELRIMVLEGIVEDILIEDESKFTSISVLTAFPGTIGNPFNLRDFEQGLDQINKLTTNKATTDIKPGEKEGHSVIVVKNVPQKMLPVGFTTSRDNQGSRSTGNVSDNVSVTLNGLFGLNEMITISNSYTHPYGDGSGHESRAQTYMLSLPFGYNTLTLTKSISNYHTEVMGTGSTFSSSGDTRTFAAVWDRVLLRGQDFKINASTGITTKNTSSFLAQAYLVSGSRKLTVWDADLSGNTGLFGGTITAGIGYSEGLAKRGAKTDEEGIETSAAHAQFQKLRYNANYAYPFEIMGYKGSASSTLTGAYGLDTLFGSEQFSVGGLSSVRGFLNTSLAGDRGWSLRNEITFDEKFDLWGVGLSIKPMIAYDYGKILWHNGVRGGTLAGAAAGVNIAAGPATLNILRTWSMIHSASLDREPAYWFGKMTLSF